MADDRPNSPSGAGHEPSERLRELADRHGGMSPGMTSPDSTQAPLSAETGEPHPATQGGTGGGVQGDEPVGDEDGR
jgi:hypothetical protein